MPGACFSHGSTYSGAKPTCRFCTFLVMPAGNFSFTKSRRRLFVVSGYLPLLSGALDAPHTPPWERASISRAAAACEQLCSCPQVKCTRSVGGCFSSHFVSSEFLPISTTAKHQSRGVDLRRGSTDGQSEQNHELLWIKI